MRPLVLSLFLCLLASPVFLDAASAREKPSRLTPQAVIGSGKVTVSDSRASAKAVTDTFRLYGGPGTPEGKFQAPDGVLPDAQGWIGVDRTYSPPKWRVSEFNAETLGGHGPGNHALWCGEPAEEVSGWSTPPGYGNSWDQKIEFTSEPVADPASGQTVGLDFYFHHDTEPGYDYFMVQYERGDQWITNYSLDGTDADASGIFTAPGLRFSDVATAPIEYAGGDYAEGDRIRVRLRFESDGAWSDEDGLWPTAAGAVQIDDIALTWSDGSGFWDMESGWPEPWVRSVTLAGDFAEVYPSLPEADPCAHNEGPAFAFVDRGQNACPPGLESFGLDVDCTTSGTLASHVVDPSFPWGVNVTGGLSDDQVPVWNEIWSPPIAWDLEGSEDDGTDITGAVLAFDVYNHLPFQDNVFFVWHVRSRTAGGEWSYWQDFNFLYHGTDTPRWERLEADVTGLLKAAPDSVQIALGVRDGRAVFGWSSTQSNSSPYFDNVSLVKYGAGAANFSNVGNTISPYYLAHDGFPVSGGVDASTAAARDALDIPFDMAGDIGHQNPAIDTGDSIAMEVEAVVPGAEIADLRMVWVLDKNPLFEDGIRTLPNRPQDENVSGGALQWSGEVLADSVRLHDGQPRAGHYFFDLPDEDLLYPGDVLRYFIQATDDAGRVSTLPANTVGFGDGVGYPRRYTVRGLPSISDPEGTQPPRLFIQQLQDGDGAAELRLALAQRGLVEGVDYDIYFRQDRFEAGIGSAGGHGATAEQLGGYTSIYYVAGWERSGTLNASDTGDVEYDDYDVLRAWHDLPGPRNMAYFGDSLVASVAQDGGLTSYTYLQEIMAVDFWSEDVSPALEGERAPRAESLHPAFDTSIVAYGGCPSFRNFDHIRPAGGAVRGHGFVDLGGAVYAGPAASVIHDRLVEGDRKVDITFPFATASVRTMLEKSSGNRTRLSLLLAEVDAYFGNSAGESPTDVPDVVRTRPSLSAHPTPFNPSTTVELVAPAGADVEVEIFDLRGRRVRELFRGEWKQAGVVKLPWDGRDAGGASVSSGVYVVRATSEQFRLHTKVVLLK